jgi:Carbohydrate esterase, sialic acid-specific acetylesterase
VLADVKKYYPDYDGKGYEVAGFGWHQGWNDRVNTAFVAQYEANLANLIRDLRKDLSAPAMPVVIANTGMADADKDPTAVKLITAQANVADPKLYPEFAGTVSTVDTRPFHYPISSPEIGFIYHWNYNGESYFHIGESMGTAMLKLMKP